MYVWFMRRRLIWLLWFIQSLYCIVTFIEVRLSSCSYSEISYHWLRLGLFLLAISLYVIGWHIIQVISHLNVRRLLHMVVLIVSNNIIILNNHIFLLILINILFLNLVDIIIELVISICSDIWLLFILLFVSKGHCFLVNWSLMLMWWLIKLLSLYKDNNIWSLHLRDCLLWMITAY